MNRKRLLVIGFLALVFGAFVSYSAYRMLQSWTTAPARPGVDVVVAAHDLQVGRNVKDEDVKVAKFQADDLPPNCFHDKSMVVGRGVVLPMAIGDVVLPSKLAVKYGDRYSDLFSPGMRAFSVRVSETENVDFVQRGARVDVLVTRTRTDRNERSATVLKDMSVIAVERKVERNSDGWPQLVSIVTLLVSPNEALTLGRLRGRVHLSLHNVN
jgi:Flp pilus assembly protein CpaB